MQKIYLDGDKKWVEVKNLKNLRFPSQPNYEFFLHRTYRTDGKLQGFTVTEKSSGAAVCAGYGSKESAIARAEDLLNSRTADQFTKMLHEKIRYINREKEGELNDRT